MQEVVEVFLVMKESEGRARGTLYEYRHYLSSFAAYCNKAIHEVRPVDIAIWLNAERKKQLSEKSIHARWAAVKNFFTWCVTEKFTPDNPVTMKPPKRTQPSVRVASYTSVQKLLSLNVASWIDERDKALIYLLLDTGMRIGEVCGLRVKDINLTSKLAHITTSKNGKARFVPFTAACADVVKSYVDNRPFTHSHLFVGTRKSVITGAFTVSGAQCMIERRCKEAGLTYINPHSVRHLFATRALNAGMRVEVVSKILGHSTVDFTLRVYAHLLMDTISREYNTHWRTNLAVQEV